MLVPAVALATLMNATGGTAAYVADLHEKQAAFVADTAKRKAAQCTRRAGKSHGIAAWHLQGLEQCPGERSVYITLSRARGRQILWDGALSRMRERYQLPIRTVQRDGQLMVEHENGSSLWIAGCDDRSQIEKFRGERYYRVSIDEAQAFPDWIESLIQDALVPALMDLNGELLLAGTPGPLSSGYFFEATTGLREFSVHRWSMLDNPHLPYAAEFLEDRRAELGEDSPTFKREYLGEWAFDLNALVYPFTHGTNSWAPGQLDGAEGQADFYGLPEGEYSFGLGIDLGFGERSTAFVLGAHRRGSGKLYLLRAYTRSRMLPTAIAAHVKALREKISSETGSGLRVVVDEGALGKGYAEQMRSLGVGCEPAQKTHKRAYQEYVQGLILGGAVQMHFGECLELVEEARKLQFDPETGMEDERNRRHCFVAGTMVRTPTGEKPIESIEVGDWVETRKGPRRVLAQWCEGKKAIHELRTESGKVLLGTGNHRIWSGDGWKQLDALVYGDTLVEWSNALCSRAEPTAATLIRPAERCVSTSQTATVAAFTARSGRALTGLFQKASTFITWTTIRSTTPSRTLRSSLGASIVRTMRSNRIEWSSLVDSWTQSAGRLLIGTGPMLAASGTGSTPTRFGAGNPSSATSAQFAGKLSSLALAAQRFARTIVTLRHAEEAASMISTEPASNAGLSSESTGTRTRSFVPGRVSTVRVLGRSEPVYNLTVDGEHEYFANGILVANCADAFLYLARAMLPRYEPERMGPREGTVEWIAQQTREEKARVVAERGKKKGAFA